MSDSKRFPNLRRLVAAVLLAAPAAQADPGCFLSVTGPDNTLMCVSQHGNMGWLGPDLVSHPQGSPDFIAVEGYALCATQGEFPFEVWDLKSDEFGFEQGSIAYKMGNGNIVVSRDVNGLLRLDQLFVTDLTRYETRITMTLTNISHWSGDPVAIEGLTVRRAVARNPTGPHAARTQRSVLSWQPGLSHGLALTDVTWPQQSTTATRVIRPSALPCDDTAPVARRALGVVDFYINQLPPGDSRTFEVRYRMF